MFKVTVAVPAFSFTDKVVGLNFTDGLTTANGVTDDQDLPTFKPSKVKVGALVEVPCLKATPPRPEVPLIVMSFSVIKPSALAVVGSAAPNTGFTNNFTESLVVVPAIIAYLTTI